MVSLSIGGRYFPRYCGMFFIPCVLEVASGLCVVCAIWYYFFLIRILSFTRVIHVSSVVTSLFCSGTLKRKMPNGLKWQQHSFYNKGGQCPPDSAPSPGQSSDLRLAGRIVRPTLLQAHPNMKLLLHTPSKIMHKHIRINEVTDIYASLFSLHH